MTTCDRSKGVASPGGTGPAAGTSLRLNRLRILLAFALLLTIVGARWWLIGDYASSVPWMDQWDAEADDLYRRFLEGSLSTGDWFMPHNEHRIVFTKLLALGLLLLNGQWDPRLQMEANALLYAVVACGLFLLLTRRRSPLFTALAAAGIGALFSLPFGSTNTLLGFQSQFYLLSAFSLCCMYALLNLPLRSPGFPAGIAAGAAALFTMGSGLVAPAAVLGVLAVALVRSRGGGGAKEIVARAVPALLLLVAGLLLRVTVPGHSSHAAGSFGEFAAFLALCLAWPTSMPLLAFLVWLPFLALLTRYLRGMTRDEPLDRFTLGLGLWVLLQACALALFRANSGEGLESRYLDILCFGILANALGCVRLLDCGALRGRPASSLILLWVAVVGFGLYGASFGGVLPEWRAAMELRRIFTAGYVATGDPSFLRPGGLPYPDPGRVAELLQDPEIRAILPAGVRPPLKLTPAPGTPLTVYTDRSVPKPVARRTHPAERAGNFSRFAVLQPRQRFEYRFRKSSELPFLFLFLKGDASALVVTDGNGVARSPALPPIRLKSGWQHVFVYCPTPGGTISGSAGAASLSFSEPKEMGGWSVAGRYAARWGWGVFGCGMLLMAAGGVRLAWLAFREERAELRAGVPAQPQNGGLHGAELDLSE